MNDFFEKTLETIIVENKDACVERGFIPFYETTVRQFMLPTGGIIDIISFEIKDGVLNCKIFELKRDALTISAINQCVEYGMEFFRLTNNYFSSVNIELSVVGSDFDELITNIAIWGINVNIITYEYNFNGIKFHVLNKGFDNIHECYTKSEKIPDEITPFIKKLSELKYNQ